ncbi:hypothetical protein PENTCL1PPCAC_11231 [Pristionchus entomophagus]|uniref:Hexosyltransferase n=1 Tax=Pristionchus entomophagus TaxID=358040 RepID=A0AAV5T0P4_9BILA|nr:hypothetical protein PENTCL1PPCAC_11231 [Pristionchus entomophagus]
MRLPHRLIYCIFSIISFSLLLLFGMDESIEEECVHSTPANQSLHRLINTLPIEKMVKRWPILDKAIHYGIIVLVISAYYEREEREEIRSLWASPNESEMIETGKSRVIFVVGRSSLNKKEAETHGDLLEIDVEETYRNMVYKIETAFRWINEKTQSQFVAKIDSDTVVHVDRLYDQLKRYQKGRSGNWLACFHFLHSPPIREKCSPWYISEDDYALNSFPTYCNGPGYVMERGAFQKIVEGMKRHKVIEVEDAFFTGIVARDRVDLVCLQEVIVPQYTEYSSCDISPSLSILPTHYQFGDSKSKKNVTAAWKRLKSPYCHNIITRLIRFMSKLLSCS